MQNDVSISSDPRSVEREVLIVGDCAPGLAACDSGVCVSGELKRRKATAIVRDYAIGQVS